VTQHDDETREAAAGLMGLLGAFTLRAAAGSLLGALTAPTSGGCGEPEYDPQGFQASGVPGVPTFYSGDAKLGYGYRPRDGGPDVVGYRSRPAARKAAEKRYGN